MSSYSLLNSTYLDNVRNIVQFLGNYSRTLGELQNHFPDLSDLETILKMGIRQGWACRVQIQPDVWLADRDMMFKNPRNLLLRDYVGSAVKLPTRYKTTIVGQHEPVYQ